MCRVAARRQAMNRSVNPVRRRPALTADILRERRPIAVSNKCSTFIASPLLIGKCDAQDHAARALSSIIPFENFQALVCPATRGALRIFYWPTVLVLGR